MSERLESTFGNKYRFMNEARNTRQIDGISEPTPPEVQEHGRRLYHQLIEEGRLLASSRLLDVGTGDGNAVTRELQTRPPMNITLVEPSQNIQTLREYASNRLGHHTTCVYNETAEQALDRMNQSFNSESFNNIILALSLQYVPNKSRTVRELLDRLETKDPGASLEIVLTGPKHGLEFVSAYDNARKTRHLESRLAPWDTGMLSEPEHFRRIIEGWGWQCRIEDLIHEFRHEDDPSKLLTRREKVQRGLLYPQSLDALGEEIITAFRHTILENLAVQTPAGETVHSLRISIKRPRS